MNSIDVVVPCYRYGHYLRECVQSILTQGVDDVRVLIIDDESPDDTPQVGAALAAADPRVTFRRHATNQGHISTYNEGIEWAAAHYMLLLSADDYLLPGSLRRALARLDDAPQVGLLFGNAVVLYDSGVCTPARLRFATRIVDPAVVMTGRDFLDLCARKGATNFVPTPTAIVRTELLKRTGGYHPDLPHTADFELWLRLAAHGSVCYLQADQAVYRRHSSNMSLGYVDEQILVDLQQRKAALDHFAAGCGSPLPDIDGWHARLLAALGIEGLRHANQALDRGREKLCDQICEFAASVDHGIRSAWQWRLLRAKRRLGLKVSPSLHPAVTVARGVARRLLG